MSSKVRPLDLARAPSDEVLLAYVDGQLSARERSRVESYLARSGSGARRVEAYRRQNRLLHAAYDTVYAQPLPPEIGALTQQVERRLRGPSRFGRFLRTAAGFLLAALVGALGWEGYRQVAEPERFAGLQSYLQQGFQLAVERTVEDPQAPLQVRLEDLPSLEPDDGTPAVPDSSGRAPDLRPLGLELIAVRLLAGDEPGAMELVYETESRARVLLYFSPSDAEGSDRFSLLQEGSLSMLFWYQRGRSFGLISELGRDELLAIGTAVQEAWRDQPAPARRDEAPTMPQGNGEPEEETPDTSAS